MIKVFNKNADKYPFERKTEGASGFDLYNCMESNRIIHPQERWIIPTGIHLQMPNGLEAQVRPRSSMIVDYGVGPVLGTVDADYRGEIKVTLINFGKQDQELVPGTRIAQLVFVFVWPEAMSLLSRSLRGLRRDVSSIVDIGFDTDSRIVTNVSSLHELSETVRGSGGHGSTGR